LAQIFYLPKIISLLLVNWYDCNTLGKLQSIQQIALERWHQGDFGTLGAKPDIELTTSSPKRKKRR
jgi:hypothetical protein